MNFYLTKKQKFLIPPFLFFLSFNSLSTDNTKIKRQYSDTILTEIQYALKAEFDLWYPLSLDTIYGGFFSDINYKWELEGRQNKMIVTQARHIWSTSNAALFFNDKKNLLNIAFHGFEFISSKMWDHQYGGFYNQVNREGEPLKENSKIIKRAYGNAFAIYGLTAYYKASGDTSALRLARDTFYWLEKNSHDPKYGGYFQFIDRKGIPFKQGYDDSPPKDYNSSIHILEAYTELYKMWQDSKLRDRLTSLLYIIRDTIIKDKGYLNLFFTEEWDHVSYKDSSSIVRNRNYYFDHISFGHDVETAYLMLEAIEVLGIKNDHITLEIAKKMVDHALENGWDNEYGGLYDRGYYFGNENKLTIIKDTKEWWPQAEALNSFLMMSHLFPDDEMEYFKKFCEQWDYIKTFLIDNIHGGWYWSGIDKEPDSRFNPKGNIWKGNYHTSRSLINCIQKLNK